MAKILIGYSACQLTRQAFEAHGHDVWTCDQLPARGESPKHFQCDVHEIISMPWDFGLFHPMCTVMTVSSSWALMDPNFKRWPGVGYHQKVKPTTPTGAARRAQQQLEFENFRKLLSLPYPVAVENPAPSSINTNVRRPSQVIHPHQFGDDASKGTGLWLTKGVPLLVGTQDVPPRMCLQPSGKMLPRWANQTDAGQNRLSPSDDRWLERSKTYPGIAAAFGDQWGRWLNEISITQKKAAIQ